MLTYGDHNGELVHVTEVEKGLACGCVCPSASCRATLVAHKGNVIAKHFKHFNGIECEYAAETSLHLLAKVLLNEALQLRVPAMANPEGRRLPPLIKEGTYAFTSARSEVRHDAFIPDTVVSLIDAKGGEHFLLVEFTVTHRCGPEKIARVKASALPMIEIDLSKVDREATRNEILELVVSTAPRKWLNCPKGEEKYEAILAERARQAEIERKRKVAIIDAAKNAKSRAQDRPLSPAFSKYGLDKLVGTAVPGDFVFEASAQRWQSALIDHFVLNERRFHPDAPAVFTSKDALALVKDYLGKAWRKFITADEIESFRGVEPAFNSPYGIVEDYLKLLERHRIVHSLGGMKWAAASRITDGITRARSEAKRLLAETQQLRDAIDELVASLQSGDARGFNYDQWFEKTLADLGHAPKNFIANNDLDGLLNYLREAKYEAANGRPDAKFYGLPLLALARRRHREIQERKIQREAEMQAALEEDKNTRREKIEKYAEGLGQLYVRMLLEPCKEFSGATPLVVATDSTHGLEKAQNYLYLHHDEAIRRRNIEIRRSEARRIARDKAMQAARKAENPEAAMRFLNTQVPQLGCAPIDDCVDQASLEAVLVRMKRAQQGYRYGQPRRR